MIRRSRPNAPRPARARRGEEVMSIPAYQRRTKQADALIAGAYLSGTNTRRVRRALAALFGGAVGKDTVSRVWRKVKGDWDAWNAEVERLNSIRNLSESRQNSNDRETTAA